MFPWNKVSFMEENKNIKRIISKWIRNNDKFLNIISVPYNSTEIFIEVIEQCLLKGKKILYITDENKNNASIVSNIKKYLDLRHFLYIDNIKNKIKFNFKICSYDAAENLSGNFDLAIYDDISKFSIRSKNDILSILNKLGSVCRKIICYSIEKVHENAVYAVMPLNGSSVPMIEPRTVLTRLDINKEIPFVVYDYIKWSVKMKRKVMICVPDEEKISGVSKYMEQYCRSFFKNTICLNDEFDKESISKFENAESAVFVTNHFECFVPGLKHIDIMVYFADNKHFSYKDFIYLCGSVQRGEENLKGEVVFLANCDTLNMEKARNITRNFNKKAWDMGLLSV